MATKPELKDDHLLFPVSGRVPGGKERKIHKMMKLDLEAARTKWIADGATPEKQERRTKADFLCYESDDGLFADFHSNRHLFITSLERAGLSPKMVQTLARNSDVPLTLGVYTHVGLHDQTAAIQSLPAPPTVGVGQQDDVAVLRATGTDGRNDQVPAGETAPHEVPIMVPKIMPNAPRRNLCESRQIAPMTPTIATKAAARGLPQLPKKLVHFAPRENVLHRVAPT